MMISTKHSDAARMNGKLFGGRKPRSDEQLRDDFMSGVRKTNTCWIWEKSKDIGGYGWFCVRGKAWKAHRYSYFIHRGSFDLSLWVLHRCDNPSCVNPNHLFLGTVKDNNGDAFRKGRNKKVAPPKSLLTDEQIAYVRNNFVPHKMTIPKLAARLGVSRHSVKTAIYGSYHS